MTISALPAVTLTELMLSVDNVLVWSIILQRSAIRPEQRRYVLAAGIGFAVVLRAAAIAVGAAAVERLWWLTPMLGVLLLVTAYRMVRSSSDAEPKRMPGGPVVSAVAGLAVTDLVFAVDSIPASFGITHDPVVIVSANVVALAALWSLFGVVQRLLDRIAGLDVALAVILAYVGASMLGAELVHIPEYVTLGVIVCVLSVPVGRSLVRAKAA